MYIYVCMYICMYTHVHVRRHSICKMTMVTAVTVRQFGYFKNTLVTSPGPPRRAPEPSSKAPDDIEESMFLGA